MISPVEDIKNRLDIVELIGSYLKLQKAGANYKANCPFHNEKTPSFVVSPARQIWHCFGCSKGGDIFKFIMETEGYEFPEALRFLGERAGVEVKKEDPAAKSERNRQFTILEEAAKFFEASLYSEEKLALENSSASFSSPLDYLKSRGLKNETIKEFRLGYAKDEWRGLFSHLTAKGFDAQDIEKAGLIIKSSASSSKFQAPGYYDRFRGRIIFPISDYNGRVVAFGGRIYPDKADAAKYVNSPETILYQKGKVLYGLHKSKSEILRSGEAVLVEGYMDFLMSWQAGVRNVAATSGTALTNTQIKILGRLSDSMFAAFDMDAAGAEAAKRSIHLALENNFDLRVVKFEGGESNAPAAKDPADLIKADAGAWPKAIKEAEHIVKFYINLARNKLGNDTAGLAREFQKSIVPLIASLPAHLERAHWAAEAARTLGVKEEAVWDALKTQNTKTKNQNLEEIMPEPKAASTRKALLERRTLGLCAKFAYLLDMENAPLENEWFGKDYAKVLKLLRQNPETGAAGRLALEAEVLLEETYGDPVEEFLKCRSGLKKEYLKEKLADITRKIQFAERGGNNGLENLLGEFHKISSELKNA